MNGGRAFQRLGVTALTLTLAASQTALAQPAVPVAPTAVTAPANAREAHATETSPRIAPDSPRASVQRFHELALQGRWVDAARYLDAPATAPAEAATLARELSEVIDLHVGWDLDALSVESTGNVEDGLPPRVDEVGEVAVGRGTYSAIRVQRREFPEGARWMFTRATVAHVDEWYEHLEGRWAREHLPPSLNARGPHDLRRWQWIALPLLALATWLLGRLVGGAVRAMVNRVVGRVAVVRDATVGDRAVGPVTLVTAALLFGPALDVLSLSRDGEDFVMAGQRAVLSAALFWSLWRAVELFGRAASDTQWAREHPASVTLVPLGVKVARVVVGAVSIVAVLSALGYPVASLLAGLGIGGLALALAAQKTGEHLFGTVAIGFDQPFRVGDWIKVDDQEGTVEAVGLRSTRIRTLDRTVISIPNGKLADMRTETVSARDRYRVHAMLALEQTTAPEAVRAVLDAIRDELSKHPRAAGPAPWVFLRRIGESSLDVEVSAWFEAQGYEDFIALRSEVLLRLLDLVAGAGARLAFPTRTVHLARPPGGA